MNASLPHNHDAERRLLGVICADNDLMHAVADALEPDAFDDHLHRRIFLAMHRLYVARNPISQLTVADAVAGDPDSDRLLERVASLVEGVATADLGRVAVLVDLVAKAARLRDIARAGVQMANAACTPGADADAVSQAAATTVLALATGGRGQRIANGHEAAQAAVARFQQRLAAPAGIVGLRTGFTNLDKLLSGLQPGRLYTFGGATAMGKTSLATDISGHVLLVEGKPVYYVSLEMSLDEVTESIAGGRARINLRQAHAAPKDAVNRFYAATQRISASPLYVDHSDRVSITQIRARARRLHAQQPLGLVVVDYLQLADGEATTRENRTQEVTKISRGLKALSRELNVPVVALSQLSREVDKRPNKRPMLGDLRESGSIEQDSDAVLFIYRDDYYNPHCETPGIAEVIVGKQRGGATGSVQLRWFPEWASFRSFEWRSAADDAALMAGAV